MVTWRSTSSAEAPGYWAIDLDDGRRRVGVGLDVDVEEGVGAEAGQGQREQDRHERAVQSQLDESADHNALLELVSGA